MVELKKRDGAEGHRLYVQNAGHVARAEVSMEGPRALVRLRASHREDLLRIVDRLHREAAERQQQQQATASERLQREAAERQQAQDQRAHEQSLTETRQQYEVRLSEQHARLSEQHKQQLVLAQLVLLYREQLAVHLQRLELHEATDAPGAAASPRIQTVDVSVGSRRTAG